MGHLAEVDERRLAECVSVDPTRLALVLKTAAIAGDAILEGAGSGSGEWRVDTALGAGPKSRVVESVWRVSSVTGIPRLVHVRERAATGRASP